MAVGWGMAIGGALSLVGGIMGSDAAGDAASQQANSAKNATALQKYIFDTQQSETAPYRNLGASALPTLASYLGLPNPNALQAPTQDQFTTTTKGTPAQYSQGQWDRGGQQRGQMISPATPGGTQFNQAGYEAALKAYQEQQAAPKDANFGMLTKPFTLADVPNDPGYQFATQQANTALQNSALAKGEGLSGNFATALQQQNQNMGFQQENQAFNQYWQQRGNIANLLGQATGLGQSGVGQSIGAGNAFASGASNTIQGAGNAQAAGTIGSANAISGALGGIGSLGTQYPLLSAYSNYLNQGTGANANAYQNMSNQSVSNYPMNV